MISYIFPFIPIYCWYIPGCLVLCEENTEILQHPSAKDRSSILSRSAWGAGQGHQAKGMVTLKILWMEEILHQLVDGLSHCNPIIYSVL